MGPSEAMGLESSQWRFLFFSAKPHTYILSSNEVDAAYSPLGEQAKDLIEFCCLKLNTLALVFVFQTWINPDSDAAMTQSMLLLRRKPV